MEWWSLAANIWERHRLSKRVNGAESAKGEGGEEEEWRYGQVRSMTTTCGRESLASLGFREKQRWRRRMRRAWMCVG